MYDIGFRIASLRALTSLSSLSHCSLVLGVSKASLSRWIKRLHPSHWHRAPSISSPSLVSCIQHLLSTKLYFSLNLLLVDLKSSYGISISKQLLHLIVLSRLNYSFKRTKKRGISKNTSVKQYDDFLRSYKSALKSNKLAAIDECGFDHRCTPTYAFSPIGTPAIATYKTSNDRSRYTMKMAIHSHDGSYIYDLSPSSCGADSFRTFLEHLPFEKGTALVLDNASIHKTKTVIDTASRKGYQLLFIPPYTPEANPIELVFGMIKSSYYKFRYCEDFTSIPCTVNHSVDLLTRESVKNTFVHVPSALRRLINIQIQTETVHS